MSGEPVPRRFAADACSGGGDLGCRRRRGIGALWAGVEGSGGLGRRERVGEELQLLVEPVGRAARVPGDGVAVADGRGDQRGDGVDGGAVGAWPERGGEDLADLPDDALEPGV